MVDVHQANDPRVLAPECDYEFAEILVQRDDDLSVACGVGENFFVARIGGPITDPFDFMPRLFDLASRAGPDAAVEQNLQAAWSTIFGCTRSWPTTRRA